MLCIYLSPIIIEDIDEEEFKRNFEGKEGNVIELLRQHEASLLAGGLLPLFDDFEFINSEEDLFYDADEDTPIIHTHAAQCEHGNDYKDKTCVYCFGDHTERIKICNTCGSGTWHRGGKCLVCDPTAPKPYEDIVKNLTEKLKILSQFRLQANGEVDKGLVVQSFNIAREYADHETTNKETVI